jgi:glycosyltransferase involved in cell wall biosynthesis
VKIAYFYPSQSIVKKDITFLKHFPSNVEILHNTCDNSVDLIYVATLSQLSKALQAKRMFNKPVVCWVWDLPYNSQTEWDLPPQGLSENSNRPNDCMNKAHLLSLCDVLISASKWTQSVLKNQYGLSSEQIYFHIDTEELDSVKVTEKTNRIIQISRYFWNKKFENTIYSTTELDNEVGLVGVRQGNYFSVLQNNTHPNVIFYENQSRENTIKLLKSSEILVSPSVFEGWGISPIEALHCGVPVLLSDLPVFQEVYEDTVLYHNRFDKDDMKEKLTRLSKDKELQTNIVKQGQLKIKDFTPEKFANRLLKILTR